MHARALAILSALAIAPFASAQVFTNSAPIAIPDSGQASAYPSTINVSGMGAVQSVAVVLDGLTHSYAGDLDILLVGPNGVGVYVISDVGGNTDFSGGTYGFAVDGAPMVSGGSTFPSAIYAPTFTVGDDSFPGAVYTYADSMTAFQGMNANGTWRLYIMDDVGGDEGSMTRGWSLVFNSRPPANADTTFTYQGRLEGVTDPVDLKFSLHSTQWFPDALSAVEWHWIISNVQVDEQGLFTVQVPYTPGMMTGGARFLEVQLSPAGQNSYTTLWPRQPVTMAPMAQWANKAGSVAWSDITSIPAGIQDGDNAGPWEMGGANTFYDAGFVGVGTATPYRRFHVVDTVPAVAEVDSSAPNGTWFTLGNTSMTRYFQMVLTGTGSSEGPGHLLIRPSSSAGSYATGGLTLTQDGKVGVNATAPDQALSVFGNASKSGGGSWATFSDARLKHDITPLTGSLDKLLQVRGVSFFYNEPEKIGELAGQRTGVVAQEVEKVFPEWVDVGASGYKSVTFRGFEALTIEALRDLRAEKDALEKRANTKMDALAAENAELRARLERLEAREHDGR